jgi:hypothetical protein
MEHTLVSSLVPQAFKTHAPGPAKQEWLLGQSAVVAHFAGAPTELMQPEFGSQLEAAVGHASPQVPQFEGSEKRSTQLPSQQVPTPPAARHGSPPLDPEVQLASAQVPKAQI